MIDNVYSLGAIAAMGLVTLALRATPFVASQWLKKHPLVQRLGQFLPLAIMTLLLIHSALGSFPRQRVSSAVLPARTHSRNAPSYALLTLMLCP